MLTQLASKAPPKAFTASPHSASSALQLYSTSLRAASTVITHSNVAGTVDRRLALGREFSSWLAALPSSAGFSTTPQTARPEDLLVFIQSHFILHHAGSVVPGLDHKVASPQGVSSAFSHLSTLFDSLGRRGPYQPETNRGNPCDSNVIQRYKQGYLRDMCQAGYQEKSAVPLTEALVLELMTHFDQLEASDALSPFEKLMAQRDGLLILYNWHSAMRGKEGGQLCESNLHSCPTANHGQLFPQGYRSGVPLPEDPWVYPTHGTKTNKRSRAHQDPAHLKKQVEPRLCFPSRLWHYLAQCQTLNQPITHFLFRPQTATRGQFKEAPYSTPSFIKMLQGHLTKIGKLSGETSHSCRRGALQATASKEGLLAAALQGRIKTPAILQRYLDPYRHLGRLPPGASQQPS